MSGEELERFVRDLEGAMGEGGVEREIVIEVPEGFDATGLDDSRWEEVEPQPVQPESETDK